MSDKAKKVFVLGVGAPKAGTTWLHSYLSKPVYCNFGCLKEYHVWDAKFIESCASFRADLKNIRPSKAFFVRYLMQHFDNFYEYYFKSLASGSVRITGDITPAYCGLSEFHLSAIKARLEDAGFDVKVIFLMRDPVDRCWSAARMDARNLVAKGGTIAEGGVKEIFMKKYNSEQYIFRTRYDLTISKLENVFLDKNIYYGIYENMFDKESIRNLSDFVGMDFFDGHESVIKNASPSDAILDEELIERCRTYYNETYVFCRDKFPQLKYFWRV